MKRGGANPVTVAYNADGTVTVTEPLGAVHTYSFAELGDSSVLKGNSGARCATWQPLTVTSANGVLTTYTYDSRRRMTGWQIGSELTTLSYWNTGLVKQVTLPDGSYMRFTYDGAHRLVRIEDAAGDRIEYTLDAGGNRTGETAYDPSGALSRVQSRVFNMLGQLWKVVPSIGAAAATTLSYDSQGSQTALSAPLARETVNEYDALNRIKKITDAASGTTLFGYDANGNLSSVTDPRGLVTAYAYNGLDEQTGVSSPDTGTRSNTYDEAGNLHTSTDARGVTGNYSYDALNRLTSISFPDQTVTFVYDTGANGAGRMTGASDAAHSMAWSYDTSGRVVSTTQVVGGVARSVGYSYLNGNLSSITTPSGQTVTYGYVSGRVSSIAVNGTPVLRDVLYDPFGPARQWTWGNNSGSIRTYDQDGKLTQLDSGGEFYQYSYDDAMRITGVSNADNPGMSWTFGYDSLDRLTSENSAAATRGWTYDADGNRASESGSLDGLSFSNTYTTAGTANRLSSISGGYNNTYSYDAAGNTASESNPRRPVSITTTTTVSYLYNALGQRVQKSGPQAPTYFVYDEAGHLLGEYGTGGALIQETVWLGDIPVATLRPKTGGGVDVFYVHADHLGTPRKISRPADNSLVWRWDSNAFGESLPNENPEGLGVFSYNLRLPGQYFDSESGLNYNYYRDGYDPAIGRYTQSDPVGLLGGINTYSYALSDPIDLYDPYGLWVPPSLPQSVVDAVTGFGDGVYKGVTLGMGNLQDVRDVMGIDGGIDKCSTAYGIAHTAGAIEGSLALSGAAFTKVAGPFGNWVRVGSSYSKTLNTPVQLSIRWGASPVKNGKYIKQIPTQVMRDLNQWLRQKQIPLGGARAADPGHFHVVF